MDFCFSEEYKVKISMIEYMKKEDFPGERCGKEGGWGQMLSEELVKAFHRIVV